ncbi:MAG: hypothetical protein EA376_03310 [Phycisphaeraceae bacterium]|nr:MAG: hypothetical protein EA376_03310 [Phycisphaeraceae bacterium]
MAVVAAAVSALGSASSTAQPLNFRIETSSADFTPLHSYVAGEVGHEVMFFCGISGMGMHGVLQNGTEIGFPTTVFSDEAHLFDLETNELFSGSIGHLPDAVREALRVTNAASVQFGHTLYIYGGYGPNLAGDDWHTRDSVTAVDLDAVRVALRDGDPLPASAFQVTQCDACQVTGARIVRMGDSFVLFGGANFAGDYGRKATETFFEQYAIKAHIIDAAISMTAPVETYEQTNFSPPTGIFDPLRRRDMNALPATLPNSEGAPTPGFVIPGGVFRGGFGAWETPMSYSDGDDAIVHHTTFTQRMNQYECPAVSLYDETTGENRFILFSGLSSHTWDGEQFVPIVGGLFNIPWTTEITQIRMEGDVFVEELVVGAMPLPTTNADLVLNPALPTNEHGQVLLNRLPANEVLLGRVFGGLRAAASGVSPATFPSTGIYDVYVVFGVRGDVNRDGVVNAQDLALLLGAWGQSGDDVGLSDLNGDGVVNSQDLAILLSYWGNNTPG